MADKPFSAAELALRGPLNPSDIQAGDEAYDQTPANLAELRAEIERARSSKAPNSPTIVSTLEDEYARLTGGTAPTSAQPRAVSAPGPFDRELGVTPGASNAESPVQARAGNVWDDQYALTPEELGGPQNTGSNIVRGFKVGMGQLKPLAQGALGLVGASIEKAFGEGGAGTKLKNYGITGYQEGMGALQPLSKETDEITTAWERAKNGDLSALADWASYGLGYTGAQMLQAGVTAAGGAILGTLTAGPVGGAAGGVAGLAEGAAVRATAQRLLAPLIAKEVARIAATSSGAKMGAEEVTRLAVSTVAKRAGSTAGLFGYAGVQEAGSIYPEAEAQAKKEGRQLTGADLAKVWGYSAGAAILEGVGDRIGLDALSGRIRLGGGGGVLARGATGAVAGATGEAATEGAQTILERLGAGQEPFSPEGIKDIINSSALGALGGGAAMGPAAALHGPAPAPQPGAENPAAIDATDQGLNTSLDAFQAARDAYMGRPSTAEVVRSITDAPTIDAAVEAATAGVDSASALLDAASKENDSRRKGAQLAAAIDQQAELTAAQQPGVGTAFDQQNAAAQAGVALEQQMPALPPGASTQYADLAAMDERTARGRLRVLRDEAANAGEDALGLDLAPHPSTPGRYAISRTTPPSLELPAPAAPRGPMPAAVAQEQALNRIESAASEGQRAVEDQPRQDIINQTMRRIEVRRGVASPAEARILHEAGLGTPYDRVDESLAPALSPDQQLQQATGIVPAVNNSTRTQNGNDRSLFENELRAQEERDRSDSRVAEIASGKQAQTSDIERTNAEAAARQPEAPAADAVITAAKTTAALRTAEQKATLDAARSRYSADDMRILEAAANGPFNLSATDRSRLGQLKKSEPRARASAAQATALVGARSVDVSELPEQSQAAEGEMSKQTHRFLQILASVFGKKLNVFDPADANFADGFVDLRKPNTININRRTTRAHLVIFGHELMHTLKHDNPAAYEAINAVMKIRAESQAAMNAAVGIRGDREEAISDLQGDLFADTSFWADVFREVAGKDGDKQAVIKLGATIMRLVNRFAKALGGLKMFDTSKMVENMDEVRSAVQKALAEYAGQQKQFVQALVAEENSNFRKTESSAQVETPVEAPAESRGTAKRDLAVERARKEMGYRFSNRFSEPRENNASGESPASLEALSRMEREKTLDQPRYRIDRNGEVTLLIGPTAVDARARSGSGAVIVQKGVGKNKWTVLDQDPAAGKSLVARALAQAESIPDLKKSEPRESIFAKKNLGNLLQQDNWAILTAENPNGKQASAEANNAAQTALKRDLDRLGAKYTEVAGKYGQEENSLAVEGITEEQARDLGREYNQDSVLTNKGLLYQDGRVTPAVSVEMFSKKPDDFYSKIGDTYFAVQLDFDKTTSPEESEVALSTRRIVGDSGRTYTPQQISFFGNTGREIEVPTLADRLKSLRKDLGKRIAQGIADQFAPIKELTKDGYMLARLSKGAAGAIEAFLHHGKLTIRDGAYDADLSGGVIDRVFEPLHGEGEDFLWWVAANRAGRLKAEDRENLFSLEDIAAGKSLDGGVTKFDYTLSNGQVTRDRTLIYRDAQKVFDEFNKNAMDMAEKSGLIDAESRHYWEHEFYVPFYRVSDERGGFGNVSKGLVRQQAFKQLKGGTDKLNSDLLANTLQNWSHLIDAAAKNRAAKATLEAAAAQGVAVEADAATIASMGKAGGKAVWFMDGGAKRGFLVEDPYLLDAINGLEYAGLRGPLMDTLSTFKHWLTVGVTASPAFKIRNLIRDSIQSMAVSDLSLNPIANVARGFTATKRDSQTYVSALASGGLIRFGTMLEGKASERVRQLVAQGVDKSTILDSDDKIATVRHKFERAFMAYSELGNRGEEINRAALYEQLVKKGVSHAEASLMARDLMDFSMQGSWTSVRFLTQVVPFMNARIQGLYKLGRAAKEDPARFATVLGGTALASLALLAIYGDDDDWKKREDFDRDNYWWFKVGGVAYRIPKPFEIGAIASLAERGVELFTDDEMTTKRFLGRVKALASDNLNMNPVPQAVKPIIDLYANKDMFTGRPIETMGMEKLDPEYRYNTSTSMLARGASTASGGALSPVQIDHLIQGYFSWLGSFAVGGADMLIRPLTNEPVRPTADYYRLATQGIAREVPENASRYVSQLYDQAKTLEQAYGTWRELLKEGKIDEARSYFEDNREDIGKHREIESVKRNETKINNQIRLIERSDMDPDEKKSRIQDLRARADRVARSVK